jgi:ABC-2 type transport system permease protein
MAKILSAVIRALVQATIVLGIAYIIGPLSVSSSFSIPYLLGVYAALFLISMGLSSIFILIAIRSTRQETQMAVVNLLNLPLMFASNAMFPASLMPEWLQTITKVNPISYATDATRQLILYTPNMNQLAIDFLFLGAFAVIFSTIGIVLSWRYLSK